MKTYRADFEQWGFLGNEPIRDFIIEADSVSAARNQIKKWFMVVGGIKIVKA